MFGLEDGLAADAPLEDKVRERRAAAHKFFTETCRDREEVIAALDKMNLAWGDVRSAADAIGLPSVIERGVITEVDDRAGGTRSTTQSPYHFTHMQSKVRGGPPHLGEHNQDVLRDWLGYDESEIGAWQDVLVQKVPD